VLGYEDTKEVSNVFQTPSDWVDFNKSGQENNPNNGYTVTDEGCFASHNWYDGTANQIPHIYWRYNVSMDRDMSDYEITSASIEAIMNASVDRNVDVPGDDTAVYLGEPEYEPLNQEAAYDYIHFTVEVSDMDVSQDNTYVIAENRTRYLGKYDVAPSFLDVDKNIEPKNETDIRFFLNRVLEADEDGHDNFTIILGISTFSADNTEPDFDYDDFDEISAKLNFEHKIDKNWTETTSSLAENSELRFLINGYSSNDYPTIKLSSIEDTLEEAISGSYDVTNLIPLKENITLTIQVHLADDFILDQPITISIDNVYFVISYVAFNETVSVTILSSSGGGGGKTKVIEEPWINIVLAIAAIGGGICLAGYIVAYQVYLKYPKPVRKVRKYRKTLKKKGAPRVDIVSRERAFKDEYSEHRTSIGGFSIGKKIKEATMSDKFDKKPHKNLIDEVKSDKILKKGTEKKSK